MKNKPKLSVKHLQIDKENATMMLVVGICSAISVFCLVSSSALFSRSSYNRKVIAKRKTAKNTLTQNTKNLDTLVAQYKIFASTDRAKNILGSSQKLDTTNTDTRSGDNAKIVLDALPSKYDFPALATSLEKIMVDGNYKIDAISGTDDELNQSAIAPSSNPAPVEIPFSISATSNYESLKKLIKDLESSIRPIQILAFSISGTDSETHISIQAKSFYKPEKAIKIGSEIVR